MFAIIFMVTAALVAFVAFCASSTGLKFFNWLNEKNWEREMQKADPHFFEEKQARQKAINNLKDRPETLDAYAEYLSGLKRNETPLPYEEFINAGLGSSAGVGNFTLKIDLYGNLEGVELEGYGEIPLETLKELEPAAYRKIMAEYEKFKRSRGFKE